MNLYLDWGRSFFLSTCGRGGVQIPLPEDSSDATNFHVLILGYDVGNQAQVVDVLAFLVCPVGDALHFPLASDIASSIGPLIEVVGDKGEGRAEDLVDIGVDEAGRCDPGESADL